MFRSVLRVNDRCRLKDESLRFGRRTPSLRMTSQGGRCALSGRMGRRRLQRAVGPALEARRWSCRRDVAGSQALWLSLPQPLPLDLALTLSSPPAAGTAPGADSAAAAVLVPAAVTAPID
jgi:hypothetical protein